MRLCVCLFANTFKMCTSQNRESYCTILLDIYIYIFNNTVRVDETWANSTRKSGAPLREDDYAQLRGMKRVTRD